ncbi:alpha/beta hydrolase, partial [Mycobacterium sp. ITM-2017-0098]
LMVVRSPNTPVVSDADWDRYRALFPAAKLHEFVDSPHDIFRPERGRYPTLVRDHVDAVDAR